MPTVATCQTIDTPHGPFTIITSEANEVLASGWTVTATELAQRIHSSLRPERLVPGLTPAAEAVRAYYAGDLDAVARVAVVQFGTALQQQGWSELRSIAPGQPVSYACFAAQLGRGNAVRPAAAICAKNAAALFVPCHRVLRSDGSLGGFAWGTEVKRSLLQRERELTAGSDTPTVDTTTVKQLIV